MKELFKADRKYICYPLKYSLSCIKTVDNLKQKGRVHKQVIRHQFMYLYAESFTNQGVVLEELSASQRSAEKIND